MGPSYRSGRWRRCPTASASCEKRARVTFEQLADRIGCGVTMLSDLERGNRELSYHWMKRIARRSRFSPPIS
jgi:hypothetical protein